MAVILENTNEVNGYTLLEDVFVGIENKIIDYHWILLNIELSLYPDERFKSNIVRINGSELIEIVKRESPQFIWGVLLGFEKNLDIDKINIEDLNTEKIYKELWGTEVTISHPEAAIQIVCWDSSATILMTREAEIEKTYLKHYKNAVDLVISNRKRIMSQDQQK